MKSIPIRRVDSTEKKKVKVTTLTTMYSIEIPVRKST